MPLLSCSLSDLAVSFLQKHFDALIDDISTENLHYHYTLRNGHVELENLALKKEALEDGFDLPRASERWYASVCSGACAQTPNSQSTTNRSLIHSFICAYQGYLVVTRNLTHAID